MRGVSATHWVKFVKNRHRMMPTMLRPYVRPLMAIRAVVPAARRAERRLPAMSDHAQRRSDRGLAVAIAGTAVIGLVSLGGGLWGLLFPPPEWLPVQVVVAPTGGIVAGIILLGFAMFEFLHRLR